jgi:hypothetical protein
MTIYTVLEAPDGKPDSVAFVPEGFAWGALILTFLWAAWHRMWVIAAILFLALAALSAATNLKLIDAATGSLIQLCVALLFGFEARQLKAAALERSGFRRAGLIQASSLDAAELAYFAKWASVSPAAAPARFRAGPEDTLGIFGNV